MKFFLAVMACLAVSQAATLNFQSPMTMRDAQEADKSTTRIVNGFPAAPGQFPYQVFLRGFNAGGGALACGGSLISNQWVLTAAHCITGVVRFEIPMGTINFNQPQVMGTSTEFIIHPQYNPNNLNNDIGLIRLAQPVTFSQNIQPIALPSADRTGETFLDAQAVVSGFGRTSDAPGSGVSPTLNFVGIRVISNAQCMLTYGPAVIVASTVCGTGADAANQSTCNGDSGGPLAIQENGASLQIGVVSFVSSAGCASGNPSGYVRTTHFRTWINQQTGI